MLGFSMISNFFNSYDMGFRKTIFDTGTNVGVPYIDYDEDYSED